MSLFNKLADFLTFQEIGTHDKEIEEEEKKTESPSPDRTSNWDNGLHSANDWNNSNSSSSSEDDNFNPSEAAGEAFRGVFGDDNS